MTIEGIGTLTTGWFLVTEDRRPRLRRPLTWRRRVRFAPSPERRPARRQHPHGALRLGICAPTPAARFVFRIEDTDRSRVTDEYIHAAIESMRWLGLDWDEGPEVGGPYGPYLQSQRMDIYREWAQRFLDAGPRLPLLLHAGGARGAPRGGQRAEGRPPGYDGHCRNLTPEQIAAYEAEGRKPVHPVPHAARARRRSPTWSAARSPSSTEYVPDFVLVRADGSPLYTLAVAVDDVLMKITHVVRGRGPAVVDPSADRGLPRHGCGRGRPPRVRAPAVRHGPGQHQAVQAHGAIVDRRGTATRASCPRRSCNYLALLGWSLGRRPRVLLASRDGRGVRPRPGQRQPGSV